MCIDCDVLCDVVCVGALVCVFVWLCLVCFGKCGRVCCLFCVRLYGLFVLCVLCLSAFVRDVEYASIHRLDEALFIILRSRLCSSLASNAGREAVGTV